MKKTIISLIAIIAIAFIGYYFSRQSLPKVKANDISVSNVAISSVDTVNSKATITLNITWSNNYSLVYDSKAFWDKAWIFVKYSTGGGADGTWNHATLSSGGTITPVTDNLGAFVDPGNNQTVIWNYGADSVANGATARIKIMAIEMVYVPEGQFYYNVGGIGGSGYNNYGGGSEALVSSTSNVPSGASVGWQNGFSAFYMAKYEVSQGQYIDFLNTISSGESQSRHDGSLYNTYRYTIAYNSANPYGSRYSTTTPNRGCNFLNWDDAKAYASWAGLRPMTEMEFEKAGRGTSIGSAVKSVYPWGDDAPSATTYSWDGNTFRKYYANYGNTSTGPADVGHYLSADVARTNQQTGASVYGIADLAGNDWEHLVNCSWTQTLGSGNGTTTPPASWPGATTAKGIRGGDWLYGAPYLRLSDRNNACWSDSARNSTLGFRPLRATN